MGPKGRPPAESPPPEDAGGEAELAGEGIADLEAAEEEKPKPKFVVPRWVRIAEWVVVGLVAVGALTTILCTIVWARDAKQVTLTLNIACPVMLALIPYTLWRSSSRWVTPAASAVYTVMLTLSTAALIGGTWLLGLELSHYEWQFLQAETLTGEPSSHTGWTQQPDSCYTGEKAGGPAEWKFPARPSVGPEGRPHGTIPRAGQSPLEGFLHRMGQR